MMQRRTLLLALMGVASLSQIPTVLAAPRPKYARGETPVFIAIDEASHYELGNQDFTVEFWIKPEQNWDQVALTQEAGRLRGYINGSQIAEGLPALDDWRLAGAGILAQLGGNKSQAEVLPVFYEHMRQHMCQHMRNGYLANLRVTRDLRVLANPSTLRLPVKQHIFPTMPERIWGL